MRHPSTARIARGARGQVTWVGLLLLGALVSGVYLAWVWGPVFLVHYEVKQTVREYLNQAIRNPNDAELVSGLAAKIRLLDMVRVKNDDGGLVDMPAVELEADDITWERDQDARPPTLHVSFAYRRRVAYPYLNRVQSIVFKIDLKDDLEAPDWGPPR